MSLERKTREQWVHDLIRPGAELTLTEVMALCLIEMRDQAVLTRAGVDHLEGMIGAIDELCARADPSYKADGQVRAALDARRAEQRRLAAAARANGEA
jgi:hypothetical protein